MSAWLRTPERVPAGFARGTDAPETRRPVPPAPFGPKPCRVAGLGPRLLLKLAEARDARLTCGAANW